MEKILKVLMVEPLKEPYISQVENTFEGMQKAVGGLMEVIDLEDDVALVCNEEGKLMAWRETAQLEMTLLPEPFLWLDAMTRGNLYRFPKIKYRNILKGFKSRRFSQRKN